MSHTPPHEPVAAGISALLAAVARLESGQDKIMSGLDDLTAAVQSLLAGVKADTDAMAMVVADYKAAVANSSDPAKIAALASQVESATAALQTSVAAAQAAVAPVAPAPVTPAAT